MSLGEGLRIAVLQHVACEPPGAYGPALDKYGTVDTLLMGRDPVVDLAGYDAVVAMGGPMGVYDVERYPWLRPEVEAIRAAMDVGVAVWGVCLGAQVLAAAAGAEVYPGHCPEVGVSTVALTDAAGHDPVFAGHGGPMTVMQWHGDTFSLPDGAVLLAEADEYRNQAFRIGRSYGLQFHVEASADLAAEWLTLPAYEASLVAARGPEGATYLTQEMRRVESDLSATAEALITAWLELLTITPGAG